VLLPVVVILSEEPRDESKDPCIGVSPALPPKPVILSEARSA
jgi:hypothetical protein